MRFSQKRIYAVVTFGLVLATAPAMAQEMKISQMRMLPDGQLIWAAGESISKQGVRIPFDSHIENDKFAGYKLGSAEIQTLQTGDTALLYFRGLKISGSFGNWRDATGAKVFNDSEGAWREVTIESVAREGERVTIKFSDEIVLKDEQKVKQIRLPVVAGYLLPAAAGATTPSKKPQTGSYVAPQPKTTGG